MDRFLAFPRRDSSFCFTTPSIAASTSSKLGDRLLPSPFTARLRIRRFTAALYSRFFSRLIRCSFHRGAASFHAKNPFLNRRREKCRRLAFRASRWRTAHCTFLAARNADVRNSHPLKFDAIVVLAQYLRLRLAASAVHARQYTHTFFTRRRLRSWRARVNLLHRNSTTDALAHHSKRRRRSVLAHKARHASCSRAP